MRIAILLTALTAALACDPTLAAEPGAKTAGLEVATATDPTLKGEAEPVSCYRLLALAFDDMPIGMTVDLCAASPSASKTVACFVSAYGHTNNGGLGLPRGLAVKLCSASPTRE